MKGCVISTNVTLNNLSVNALRCQTCCYPKANKHKYSAILNFIATMAGDSKYHINHLNFLNVAGVT